MRRSTHSTSRAVAAGAVALLAALLLWPLALWSAPLVISGMDGVDQSSTAGQTDSFEFEAVDGGGADSLVQMQTSVVHGCTCGAAESGCTSAGGCAIDYTHASRWAALSQPSGTGAAYYQLRHGFPMTGLGYAKVAASVSLHVDTKPTSSGRPVFGFWESATRPGCFVALGTDGALTLYYNTTATTWGSTALTLPRFACSKHPLVPCLTGTAATDCPNGAGESCSEDRYWAGVELVQSTQSATSVICELYLNGEAIFTGTAKAVSGATNARNLWFGALNGVTGLTGSGAITYYDDLVIDDEGARVGFGFVVSKAPTAQGPAGEWNLDTCGAGATSAIDCLNDYAVSPYTYLTASSTTSDTATRGNENKQVDVTGFVPDVVLPSESGAWDAAGAVVLGRTATADSNRAAQVKLGAALAGACGAGGVNQCASGLPCTSDAMCASYATGASFQFNRTSGTTCSGTDGYCSHDSRQRCDVNGDCRQFGSPQLLTLPFLRARSPIESAPSWASALNATLVVGVRTQSITDSMIRLGALLFVARFRRPDVGGTPTLRDHNRGANDGLVSVALIGDSTLQGSLESTCTAGANVGQACSQDTYCSWDSIANDGFQDTPVGGCSADVDCRTCTGRRGEFANGAGYACTATANCNLGTCGTSGCETPSGQCCSGDSTVSCTVSGDCNLGTCDTTATCDDACPDGSCPTARVGWGVPIAQQVPLDALLVCGKGGEDIEQMRATRFDGVSRGVLDWTTFCQLDVGTGACGCTTNADCGTGGTCSAEGSGGVPTDGRGARCTAGDFARTHCTRGNSLIGDTDCAGALACLAPPPDHVVVLEPYNATLPVAFGSATDPPGVLDPQCRAVGTITQGAACPTLATSGTYRCAPTTCTADTGCSGVSPTSTCTTGRCLTASGIYQCSGNGLGPCFGVGNCSVSTAACRDNADCGAGFTCVGALTHSDVADSPGLWTGRCACDATASCPSGYACVGDSGSRLCRKTCTVSGDCQSTNTGLSCATTTDAGGASVKVCQALCRCDCQAITCTSDADCGQPPTGKRALTSRARPRYLQGTCNPASGRCWNCGYAGCTSGDVRSGPCSCTTNADCGTGGTCSTEKVCTAGEATRTACGTDGHCGPGQRCLAQHKQFLQYLRGHAGLVAEASVRMQRALDGLADADGGPLLWVSEAPLLNGLLVDGVTRLDDRECTSAWHQNALVSSVDWLAGSTTVPARRVIAQTAFNRDRFLKPYHVDSVHFSSDGSLAAGQPIADVLNRANICVTDATGAPQLYCVTQTGTATTTACTTSADCEANGTCTGGKCRCQRRRCDGSDANCPAAGDTCFPE